MTHLFAGITRWWLLKVFAGLALIGHAVWSSLDPAPPSVTASVAVGLLVLTGAAIHLGHYALFKRHTRDLGRPAQLVTKGGLLSWIRHPMYLGDLMVGLGFWGMQPTLISTVLLAALGLGLALQCRVEDAQLIARFGSSAQAYKDRTQALLPFW